MPATRTGTDSARSMSTRWRGSGPCCVPGCGRTGASRRRSCPSTSASSSSCTTPGAGAGPCSANSSPPWWREVPTTPDPDKSVDRIIRERGSDFYNWGWIEALDSILAIRGLYHSGTPYTAPGVASAGLDALIDAAEVEPTTYGRDELIERL